MYSNYFTICCFPVPLKGPPNVNAHNGSSFSINATWSPLETEYRLGILLKYRIYCRDATGGIELYKDVGANTFKVEIENLKPYWNYSIEVAAGNIKGIGPKSAAAFTLTDEYSKYFCRGYIQN